MPKAESEIRFGYSDQFCKVEVFSTPDESQGEYADYEYVAALLQELLEKSGREVIPLLAETVCQEESINGVDELGNAFVDAALKYLQAKDAESAEFIAKLKSGEITAETIRECK